MPNKVVVLCDAQILNWPRNSQAYKIECKVIIRQCSPHIIVILEK